MTGLKTGGLLYGARNIVKIPYRDRKSMIHSCALVPNKFYFMLLEKARERVKSSVCYMEQMHV
jgi:hypothetical protein